MPLPWSEPVMVKPSGSGNFKKIPVKTACQERFCLYQTTAMKKKLRLMWQLFDSETKTSHFLMGSGWEGAQEAAEARIKDILRG